MHGVANNWSDFLGSFVIGQKDTPQEPNRIIDKEVVNKIWVDLQIFWN